MLPTAAEIARVFMFMGLLLGTGMMVRRSDDRRSRDGVRLVLGTDRGRPRNLTTPSRMADRRSPMHYQWPAGVPNG
jgi:hypothetical protein